MSTTSRNGDDGYATVGIDAKEHDRYADVALENGEVMIYDRNNEDAWIQSDSAIGRDVMI